MRETVQKAVLLRDSLGSSSRQSDIFIQSVEEKTHIHTERTFVEPVGREEKSTSSGSGAEQVVVAVVAYTARVNRAWMCVVKCTVLRV